MGHRKDVVIGPHAVEELLAVLEAACSARRGDEGVGGLQVARQHLLHQLLTRRGRRCTP